jgi:periplasmic protein TonB
MGRPVMSVRSLSHPHSLCVPAELSRATRRSLTAMVLLAHGLAAWGLWQVTEVQQLALSTIPTIQVEWIAAAERAPSPPVPTAPPRARPVPAIRALISATASPATVAVAPSAPQPPTPEAVPAKLNALAVASATSSPPAAPPSTPPGPRLIPASAVMYLIPPAQAYPLASRRLREQGTVLLKLRVDEQGLPQSITLHRGSGHTRLDEQALQAMRAARFKPHTEHGVATAWMAIAPLTYELH